MATVVYSLMSASGKKISRLLKVKHMRILYKSMSTDRE